jgi:hypothetical protein
MTASDHALKFLTDTIKSDDRALQGLSKVLVKLQEQPMSSNAQEISKHCNRLKKLRSAEIQARFLRRHDNNHDHVNATSNGQPSDWLAERDSLRNEVQALRAEIAPVVSMVVEHEFQKPIDMKLRILRRTHEDFSRKCIEYVSPSTPTPHRWLILTGFSFCRLLTT